MCAFCNSGQFAKTPPGGLRERRICPINKLQVVFIAETYFTNRGQLGYHGVILLKPSDAMVNNVSCIGLSHVRCEETACNSDDVLTTGPLGMNFRDILKRKNAKKKRKRNISGSKMCFRTPAEIYETCMNNNTKQTFCNSGRFANTPPGGSRERSVYPSSKLRLTVLAVFFRPILLTDIS